MFKIIIEYARSILIKIQIKAVKKPLNISIHCNMKYILHTNNEWPKATLLIVKRNSLFPLIIPLSLLFLGSHACHPLLFKLNQMVLVTSLDGVVFTNSNLKFCLFVVSIIILLNQRSWSFL